MKTGALHTRTNQIALLTQGVHLPLPEIPREHLDIIVESIIEAYDDVKASQPAIIATEDEVEITMAVRNALIKMIQSSLLFGSVVQYVARGEEHSSYNGKHKEKRPDFSFKLSFENRIFPLLAEAKVVKPKGGKSIAAYCSNGISRFVRGEYGWWDKDAIMIAYAVGGQTVAKNLTPYLVLSGSKKKSTYAVGTLPTVISLGVQSLPRSKHYRKFRYIRGTLGTGYPGMISIWHLWLC